MKAFTFLFALLLIGMGFCDGQSNRGLVQKTGDCSGFYEKNCVMPEGFERNGQSKSALFSVNDTSMLSFVAYAGHDYAITICKDEVLSNEVRFKVYDTKMVKNTSGETVSYEKKQVVVWDNKNHDNTQKLEFSNPENSRRLKIQVITKGESSKSSKLKTREMGCLGISIGHAPTRDTGF